MKTTLKNNNNNSKKVCDSVINVQLWEISSLELQYHTYPKQIGVREVSSKALCIINTH